MTNPIQYSTNAQVEVPPQDIAMMFWELDVDQMCEFFETLEDIAGIRLCLQMASVVHELQKRSDKGDYKAWKGFQTMLNHAKDLCESATDYRVWSAQREISAMAEKMRLSHD